MTNSTLCFLNFEFTIRGWSDAIRLAQPSKLVVLMRPKLLKWPQSGKNRFGTLYTPQKCKAKYVLELCF